MRKLNGPFKDIIPLLVKMKKSSGYKYDNINSYIELDSFLYKNGIKKIGDEIFVVAVLNEKNERLKRERYYALENLNVVLELLGLSKVKTHKIDIPKREKFVARILTDKELKILFNELDNQGKSNKNNYIYQVLIRLLYSSGLRISEALALKIGDYNRDDGSLLINNSKNKVTRYVVLSNSMKAIFEKYIEGKERNEIVFNTRYDKVHDYFQMLIISLSLEPCRLHDLRHIFAVKSLNKNIRLLGEEQALYYLSTYMGHKNIENTVYYLQLTDDHIKKMHELNEETNNYIFGGVENE